MYLYEKLIEDNGIIVSHLPKPIRDAIQRFETLEFKIDRKEGEEGEDDPQLETLKEKLQGYDKALVQLIKDFIALEDLTEEASDQEQAEAVLASLKKERTTLIHEKDLKARGFPKEQLTAREMKFGEHRLTKKIGSSLIYMIH